MAEATNVALAISLHAPDDELRNELVPINRRHPIAELLEACWDYADVTNAKQITFEYIMLDDVNDQPHRARELVRLLKGHPAKVNLIPFNPVPGTPYGRTPQARIDAFRKILLDAGSLPLRGVPAVMISMRPAASWPVSLKTGSAFRWPGRICIR